MIPLLMVVRHVLRQISSKRGFAQQDQLRQALLFLQYRTLRSANTFKFGERAGRRSAYASQYVLHVSPLPHPPHLGQG